MRVWLLFLAFSLATFGQARIDVILDGAGLTPDIAQGSIFIVKGQGIAPAGVTQAPAPRYPTTLNGVRLTIQASPTAPAIPMPMVYVYNQSGVEQLAALLPSSVPTGTYFMTAHLNTTATQPVEFEVLPRKPGIVTAEGSGRGLAQATLEGAAILQRTTTGRLGDFTTRPAKPGDRVDLWGTGLGPDAVADTGGTSGDQTSAGEIRVIVNGTPIIPLYAGRSPGFPGLDQIVFRLPENVALRCDNTVQVVAGGSVSNIATLATAVSGNANCSSPVSGTAKKVFTATEVAQFVARGALREGAISLYRNVESNGSPSVSGGLSLISTSEGAFATFSRFVGPDLGKVLASLELPDYGACLVATNASVVAEYNYDVFGLDAGRSLTMAHAGGSATLEASGLGSYAVELTVPGSASNFAPGETRFTIPGGPDIATFQRALTFSPDFALLEPASFETIDRATPLRILWNGGDPSADIFIVGASAVQPEGAGHIGVGQFTCRVRNSTRQFTVPTSILQQLPATETDQTGAPQSGYIYVAHVQSARSAVTGLDIFEVTASHYYTFSTVLK
jgi:uncharacterized protein (TIGR03437 family)